MYQNRFYKKIISIIIVFVTQDISAISQDTQYWTRQVGTRSAMMGGTVIASSRDNTAILYNPGNLGWVDTAAISINGTLNSIENIKIENALGQKADFKSSQIGSIPLLLGGMLKTKSQSIRLAYGVMLQSNFNFKANARVEGQFPLIDNAESPGNEHAVGQLSLQSRLNEQAAGIGMGKRFNEHFSAGVSGFLIVRTPAFNRYVLTRLYLNQSPDPLVTTSIIQSMDYYNVRFQPKVGFSYQAGKLTTGLSIALPSVRLMGKGNIAFDALGTNIKPVGYTNRIDFIANDRQEKLKSTYKSPFSVAAGVGYDMSRSHFEVALQYFSRIKTYSVINARPTAFARPQDAYPDLTSDKYLRVLTAARPVFNAGIAWEYQLNPVAELYVSARSDQSFFDSTINSKSGIKPDISSWNIYHLVIGGSFHRGRSSLSIGIAASAGVDKKRQQPGNINGDSESNFFQGTTTITKATYNAIGLILGYTYNFKKF